MDEAFLDARVRPRFSRVLAQEKVYLANHSLGRPPDRMADDVRGAMDAWLRDMEGAWGAWIEGRERFRALTARLAGAPEAKSIVPKTSAGQGLRAVLNALPGRPRVLATDEEFDSLDFILRVYRDKGRIDLKQLPFDRFEPEPCELVVVSSVAFRTGRIFPQLREVVRKAHAMGAMVLVDTYHHAGALPLDLAALDCDFAVGGSYKYLRGGPGACWLYVHPRHYGLRTLDTGWFAKKEPFRYERPDPPEFAPGGDGWLESTPPVLVPFQALAGLEITLELGAANIRANSLSRKRQLRELLLAQGIESVGAGEEHGAFLTVVSERAAGLSEALSSRGVKTDARGRYLRLCPDYLNTPAELERAAATLGALAREAGTRA